MFSLLKYHILEINPNVRNSMVNTSDGKMIERNILDISIVSNISEKEDHIIQESYIKHHNSLKKYININNRSFTVKFIPRKVQGLANHIRSIRGLLLLAMVNNANFCVDYDDYYTIMNNSLSILKCPNNLIFKHWEQPEAVLWIKNRSCNYYIHETIEISSCYDLSYYFIHCDNFLFDVQKNANNFAIKNYLEYSTQFLFQPKQYIIEYSKSILNKMKGIKVGIQLRFGGKTASTIEGYRFLDPSKFNTVLKQINQVLKQNISQYSVFLSSDSKKAVNMLKPLKTNIITANQYTIGHTRYNNISFLQRAVTDIYILSHCDILIYTFHSSYGRLARDLSQTNQIYVVKT